MLTACGPVMATADVNGDGLTDVFAGGTEDNPGKLFIQNEAGSFNEVANLALGKKFTDADALFLDVDGDKDVDLYIVSGGYNEYKEKDDALQDRLYINDGKGNFTLASALPDVRVSKSCIAARDFDHDGDVDVFLGGRVIPGKYPATPESFLLRNQNGKFESAADVVAPGLSHIGMVTDAAWLDLNGDRWEDLVVIGEFMAIEVYVNEGGKQLVRSTDKFFDRPATGLWNKLIVYDFDGDGDDDIIAGNLGLNTQLHASPAEPLTLVSKDFDNNGSLDPILVYYLQGKPYPFPTRDELLDQMYGMRKKFTSYASYADAQLSDIFSDAELKDAAVLKAEMLESVYLENTSQKLVPHALPTQAQFAPLYAFALTDFNGDGHMDVIVAGNQSSIRIRMGVIDANFGQLLAGDGKGNFRYVPQGVSGLTIIGDVKSLEMIRAGHDNYLLLGVNNVGIANYKLRKK